MTITLIWTLLASFAFLSNAQDSHDHHCPGGECILEHGDGIWTCVTKEMLCDGHSICEDGSDEKTEEECREMCHERWCDPPVNGVVKGCMSDYMICNGVTDCDDGSHEPANCGEMCPELWCDEYKMCMEEYMFCNGEPHCPDGSDELVICECPGGTCKYPGFSTEVCVTEKMLCNGWKDCEDGSDEKTEEECREMCPELWCDSLKVCMSDYMICNGVTECDDGSDEPDDCEQICGDIGKHWCGEYEAATNENIYHQYINACLPGDSKCNYYQDCADRSDEEGCYD